MSYPRLTLDLGINGEQFIVDRYMGVYYIPYEDSDDSYQFHVSELNYSHYERLWKEIVAFQQENGFSTTMYYKDFLFYMESCFQMYDILRKLPS